MNTEPLHLWRPVAPRRVVLCQAGFTLIEMLIVIGLIGLLMAFLLPNLGLFGSKGAEAVTQSRILFLKGCADAFEREHGTYPPDRFQDSFFRDFKAKSNGVNEGIESLIAHMHYKKVGSWHFEDKQDWLGNTDDDDGNYTLKVSGVSKLMEVLDGWGNPIAYLHRDSYGKPQKVMMGGGAGEVEVSAAQDPNNQGKYLNRSAYQLISAGDDGLFGTADDIAFPEAPAKAD